MLAVDKIVLGKSTVNGKLERLPGIAERLVAGDRTVLVSGVI
jgi:hypothetical protein